VHQRSIKHPKKHKSRSLSISGWVHCELELRLLASSQPARTCPGIAHGMALDALLLNFKYPFHIFRIAVTSRVSS
jgi:hypothetical protein